MSARLFLQILSLETRKIMSYRVDFWLLATAGVVVGIVIPYFLWRAIYAEAGQDRIAGMGFTTMVVYYVAVVLMGRVVRGPDLAQTLSLDIYEGGLNRYLVYPTDYLRFKYGQHLGQCMPGILQLFVFSALLLGAFGIPDDVGLGVGTLLRASISVAVANVLYFLLVYPLQALAFWADNVWSLTVLLRFVAGLLGGSYLPLNLFPEWAQPLLTYLPFQHLFYLPVRTLMGELSLEAWTLHLVGAIAWTVGIYFLGRWVWRRGEIGYSGVGI